MVLTRIVVNFMLLYMNVLELDCVYALINIDQ